MEDINKTDGAYCQLLNEYVVLRNADGTLSVNEGVSMDPNEAPVFNCPKIGSVGLEGYSVCIDDSECSYGEPIERVETEVSIISAAAAS